jgi:hypothetical protein
VSNSGAGPWIGARPSRPARGIEDALLNGSDKVVVVTEDGHDYRVVAWSPTNRRVQITDGGVPNPAFRWVDVNTLEPVGTYGETEVWVEHARLSATWPSPAQRKADAYVAEIMTSGKRRVPTEATGDEREVAAARAARQQARERAGTSRPVSVRAQRALEPGDGE